MLKTGTGKMEQGEKSHAKLKPRCNMFIVKQYKTQKGETKNPSALSAAVFVKTEMCIFKQFLGVSTIAQKLYIHTAGILGYDDVLYQIH